MSQMKLFDCPSNTAHDTAPATKGAVWNLFVDGASRNNPGKSGAGIYIVKDSKDAGRHGFFLGVKTNNEAEYLALLIGLFLVQKQFKSHDKLVVISDSLLIVKQIEGAYKVRKKELLPFHTLALKLITQCNKASVRHVLRQHNVHADAMANEGIDKKIPIPNDFMQMLYQHGIIL
jgi:ribonuclease HI